MFEQDYIMRLIHEMVRAILKIMFQIESESPELEMIEKEETQGVTEQLLSKIDNGELNEAENELYELLSGKTRDHLMMGLLFYSHLNEKSDEFLTEHFSGQDWLIRREFETHFDISRNLALKWLKTLVAEGALCSRGARNPRFYTPVPGHFGR